MRRFRVPLAARDGVEDLVFLPEATGHDWARILGHAEVRRFSAGDLLVRAGEPDRALCFLVDGSIRVDGPAPAPKTIEAPSVVGEVAFLDGGPRSADLVARTDGRLARFDMASYDALAAEDPELARRMALELGRVAAVRLRSLTERGRP